MRRTALAAACGLALAFASAAAAHVTFTPTAAAPGATVRLLVDSPNESTASPIVALELIVPSGVVVGGPEAKPGWSATVHGGRVDWAGGSIPPGQFATFSLDVTAPDAEGPERFLARQHFADGSTEEFRPVLTVRPASQSGTPGRDNSARSLGKAALFLAVAAVVLAAGAGFLGLWLWLRPRGDDAA